MSAGEVQRALKLARETPNEILRVRGESERLRDEHRELAEWCAGLARRARVVYGIPEPRRELRLIRGGLDES